jgi:Sulfotransferase domain
MSSSPKVVFIGGYSRSGSTLLDRMLGQLPGFFSTGELGYIWTHGLQANQLCGCGERFLSCPFWDRVGEAAFGGWDAVDVTEMLSLERSVNRHRFLPFLVAPRLSDVYRKGIERYTDALARLFRAIATVSGARVIIDSTIDPAYGFVLRRVPGLDLRLVHMVRDSRATAFSWTRWQRKTDRLDSVVYQRRFHPAVTAVRWMAYHWLVHLLNAIEPRELLVRYESVVQDPREEILRIVRHIGERNEHDLDFIGDGEVVLQEDHTVAGSLMRLAQGPLPVRLDDEWATNMNATHRRAVTVLTWPLLRRYGYTTSGSSGRTRSASSALARHN